MESPAADQRSLTVSENYSDHEINPPFFYKSPFLLRELALFSCIFPCAEATYFYKRLCLPKSLEETMFISMVLAVHESRKCLVTQLYTTRYS